MDFFNSEIAPKLTFVLGIINLISGLLVLFTCRCIPGLRISGNLMQNKFYKQLYKYHCYIWWVFWISVVVHAVLAIGFFGWPF
jgi:hypothetical protein